MDNKQNNLEKKDYLHLFFLTSYFAIPYFPQLGAIDVVGPHWYVFSSLNLIMLVYLWRKKYLLEEVLNNFLFFSVVLFILWGGYSLTYTINLSEGLLVYSRLINTVIGAVNIALLLKNRTYLIHIFSVIISIFLIGESIYVFNLFFGNPQKLDIDSLILSIKGNSGNKNIFAAAILFKLPFSLYLFFNKKNRFKYLAISSFFLGVASIFILNARSTFVGLFFIVISVIFFSFYTEKKKGVIIVIIALFGFLFSNFFLQLKLKNLENQRTLYGTTISRVATINFNQSGRKDIWLDCLYAIKNNPIRGCGIGNWKIIGATSTHGTQMYSSDWTIPYHAHNDFLEMFIELGLIGGLLFIMLFIILIYVFIRKFKDNKSIESKLFFFLLITCLFVYVTDSIFNFPLERPVMQLNFAFLIAMGLCLSPITFKNQLNMRFVYLLLFILLFPATVIAKKCYDLLTLQNLIGQSHISGNVMPLEVIDKCLSIDKPFPSLSYSTVPFDAMIANEYAKNNSFDKALKLLYRSMRDNPMLGYNEAITAFIYLSKQEKDSARKYVNISWNKRFWASSVYTNALLLAQMDKDTIAMNNYFKKMILYRKEPFVPLNYIKAKSNVVGHFDLFEGKTKLIIDKIIKKFPETPETIELIKILNKSKKSREIEGKRYNYAELSKLGLDLFIKQKYEKALFYFIEAYKLEQTDYTIPENIGLLFFTLRKYDKAVFYFKKVLETHKSLDGKSDFYLGLSLVALNNKDEACKYFTLANNKGFANANEQLKLNCAN